MNITLNTSAKSSLLAITAFVVTTLLLGPSTLVAESGKSPSAFEQLLGHYEPAREALTRDSMGGVAAQGGKIQGILDTLAKSWSAEAAGIQGDMGDEIRELLPTLQKAAAGLAEAEDIETARDAFYELSKGLVRWRKAATTDDKPVVAYCSMSKRSWLQPAGDLTNPYHGQSMLRCGQVVDG